MLMLLSFSVSAQTALPAPDARMGDLLQGYCITCHNETLKTAGLMLDQANKSDIHADAATWEKVARRLRARSMPPQGLPRPDESEYEYLIECLEGELDRTAAVDPNPGRSIPHRLNRAEYTNAVRDIFDLEIDAEKLLPNDAASRYGFDNIADILTLSPVLMERYLSAAKTISRMAVGDQDSGPVIETYMIPDKLKQQERLSKDLPFGSNGGVAIDHYFALDGEYVVKVRLRRLITGLYANQIIGFEEPREMDIRLDGTLVANFSVGGEGVTDDHLEVRLPIKAGMHTLGVSFLRNRLKQEGIVNRLAGTEFGEGVGWVDVEGPYNISGVGETPSRNKIFSCRPVRNSEDIDCARAIITTLSRNAYRRPVSGEDIEPLLALYQSGNEDDGFENGIQLAIQGILVSPKFLFRVEEEPAGIKSGTAYNISDLELASRLSFFLWSSVPDAPLLKLAEQDNLREPDTLHKEVKRMLADPRSRALVENFASQWLHVRNLDLLSPPDPNAFPEYNHNLKEAFRTEIELLFEYVIKEDRSIADFLSADYSFLNERLAEHYGIPGVYGSHFRRVSLPEEHRWGLLGKGSILTVTSYATRTSPTLRGKWVLDNILGTPPPPPPPDVPSLKETAETKKLSMKERMELHRTNPVCASCHSLMDPLGLALENFDAIGSYRELNADQSPIDATGKLPNGTEFDGPAELREALWQIREQFIGTFIERMLTYALGRGIEYYDMPAVRQIKREAAKQDYRWSSIVMQVVESQPFQMRRSISP
jgi:hypothetical protein